MAQDDSMSQYLFDGPEDARVTFILSHGAGAPMDSPLLTTIARGLARSGLRVIRFEFPYMRARREGGRRPPDRQSVLLETWREVIEAAGDPARLFIGGHSMGGRMATMIADEMKVAGLCCISYPFHPPDHPGKTRIDHLKTLATPAVLIQGTRDPFGTPDEVHAYELSASIQVDWLEGADHSLKPPRKSPVSWQKNLEHATRRFVAFANEQRAMSNEQ